MKWQSYRKRVRDEVGVYIRAVPLVLVVKEMFCILTASRSTPCFCKIGWKPGRVHGMSLLFFTTACESTAI
jgi:hypothetical protein